MKKILVGLLLVAGFVGLSLLISPQKADAAWGRANYQGYFTGSYNNGSGDFVLPGGTDTNPSIPYSVDTVGEFENFILSNLDSSDPWQHTGAAFIVQSMRGGTACNSGSSWCTNKSINSGDPAVTDWKNRISDLLASGGHIDFGPAFNDSNCVNTMDIKDHVGGDADPEDVASYPDCTNEKAIVFWSAGPIVRPLYVVKYRCANPIGGLPGLPLRNWNLTDDSEVNDGSGWTTSNVSVPNTSKTVQFRHEVSNKNDSEFPADYKWRVEGCYLAAGGSCTDSDYGPNIDGGNAYVSSSSTSCYNQNEPMPNLTACTEKGVNPGGNSSDLPITLTYHIKSGASPGAKYCQRIAYSNKIVPDYDLSNIQYHSNPVCVTLGTPPSGTVACTIGGSPATATVTATASDDDTSSTYKLKAYITSGGVTYVTKVSSSSPASFTWTGIPVPATNKVTVTLHVPDVGANPSGTFTVSATCGTSGGTDCPNGGNTTPSITLPQANLPTHTGVTSGTTGPPASTTSTGALYTTSSGAEYYQETPKEYRITDAHDQYSPSTSLGTTMTLPTAYQSSNVFTLNYKDYVDSYPYDDHATTVVYNQKFDETYWSSSKTVDFYTCPSSMTNNNNGTCTYNAFPNTPTSTYPASNCVNGGSNFDGTYCWKYAHPYDVGTPKTACSKGSVSHAGACYVPYNPCASGDTLSGSTCTHTGTTTYSCIPGDSGPNSNNKCTHTAEYDYYWHKGNATPASVEGPNTTYNGSPALGECFYRDFDVAAPGQTDVVNVTLGPNTESPSSVTINTNTTVIFSLTEGGVKPLRHGMGVNGIHYSASYYIEHANGTVENLGGGAQTSYDFPEIGGSVMNSGGSASAPFNTAASVSVPPLAPGDVVCAQFTITPGSGTMNENAVMQSSGGSQDSTRIPGGSTCSAPVSNAPYTRFYGNDILAGAQFSNGGCNSNAFIAGYRNGRAGAGSQFAAMSLGQIQNFASAFLRSSAPLPATGLSFANTVGGDGGSFNNSCLITLPDYFAVDQPSGISPTTLDTVAFGAATAPGSYPFSAPAGTLGSQFIQNGVSVAIFVDGDVYINGNITYNPGPWNWDTDARSTNVPSFYIIAKGNIDIAPGVSQLDGVYIAEGSNGTGGTIRTCSDPNLPHGAISAGSLFATCSNTQLVVNGAFIAREVRLDRTYKSLRDAAANESPFGGTQNAAETFNFSPEVYLNNPALKATGGSKVNKFDFITSLAPVL